MTYQEIVAKWHRDKPEFTHHWTARDWGTAEEVAEAIDNEIRGENVSCDKAPAGRYCTLEQGHAGGCVTFPLEDA